MNNDFFNQLDEFQGIQEKDKRNFVTIGKSVTQPDNLYYTYLEKIISSIKCGTWKYQIDKIRSECNEQKKKNLKKGLPYFIYGIVNKSRKDSNVQQMNGLIIDLDKVNQINETKNLLKQIDEIRYIFRSPISGLKIIIPFSQPVKDKNLFILLQKNMSQKIEEKTGLKCDNTMGWSQACFLSYDPSLIDLGSNHFLNIDDISLKSMDKVAVKENHQIVNPIDENESIKEIREAVKQLATIKIDYNDWIKCGLALFNYFSEINNLQEGKNLWLQFANNPNYDDNIQGLSSQWDSFQKSSLKYDKQKVNINTLFYFNNKYKENIKMTKNTKLEQSEYKAQQDLFNPKKDVTLDKTQLPQIIRDIIEIMNKITCSPEGFKLLSLLAVSAATIGNKVYVFSNKKYYANIYALLIGPSRLAGKSTCIDIATELLKSKEKSHDIFNKVILKDSTQIQYLNSLEKNPNKLLVCDEFSSFLQNATKIYNNNMLQNFNSMFCNNDIIYRSSKNKIYIKNPAPSILGAITPEGYMKTLNSKYKFNEGFNQRFLYVYINSENNIINENASDKELQFKELQKYNKMLYTFYNLKAEHKLIIPDEAFDYYNNYIKNKELDDKECDNYILESYKINIYNDYFYKLLIIVYLIKNWQSLEKASKNKDNEAKWFQKNQVDLETVQQVLYLCDYFFENIKLNIDALYAQDLNLQVKIYQYIKKQPDQKILHTILRKHFSSVPTNEFNYAIQNLIKGGYLKYGPIQVAKNNRKVFIYQIP